MAWKNPDNTKPPDDALVLAVFADNSAAVLAFKDGEWWGANEGGGVNAPPVRYLLLTEIDAMVEFVDWAKDAGGDEAYEIRLRAERL